VPARIKSFGVLVFKDRDGYGYDEHALPALVALMDSAGPDQRLWTHVGVTGFFLPSRHALARLRSVIAQAEMLRASDARFQRLGIGLAEGRLVAEFTWFGRLKSQLPPLGLPVNTAHHSAAADNYLNVLCQLDW
jgi:hypothetical protein